MLFRFTTRLFSHVTLVSITTLTLAACGSSKTALPTKTNSVTTETQKDHADFAEIFRDAAVRNEIPSGLLEALSYIETRWHPANAEENGHEDVGEDHHRHVYGIMGLHEDGPRGDNNLVKAATLLGASTQTLKTSTRSNIDGAALLLKSIAREQNVCSKNLSDWSEVVRTYTGIIDLEDSDAYLSDVFATIRSGVSENGIEIAAQPDLKMPANRAPVRVGLSLPGDGDVSSLAVPKPPMTWAPSVNFVKGGIGKPKYIVIHVTQGAFAGAVSWLRSKRSGVSAHYVVQSKDGLIKQLVKDEDRAYHARCWNSKAIGIEHEGFITRPEKYFTDAMYSSSANLVRYLTEKYSIPRTNLSIVGHNLGNSTLIKKTGLSDCNDHDDPGPGWAWPRFFSMISK